MQFADLWAQGVMNKVRVGWSINILLLWHAKGGGDSLVVISKNHYLLQLCLRTAKFHGAWVLFPHPHSRLRLQFGLVESHPCLNNGYNSIQKVFPLIFVPLQQLCRDIHSSCFLFGEFIQYLTRAHLSHVQMLCNNVSHGCYRQVWLTCEFFDRTLTLFADERSDNGEICVVDSQNWPISAQSIFGASPPLLDVLLLPLHRTMV